MGLSLDDTLHAVVQLTHEHGLPLHGVGVSAGRVQVHAEPADVQWWARWLTDASADACRHVVWEHETGVAFHLHATREGIEWTVAQRVPVTMAAPILATHDVALSAQHLEVPATAAIALADALASHHNSRSGVNGGVR